jgi:NAD(P)-dependent dehydrogenase (short-subunit alcohol dehydrogenase family)
MIVGPLGAAISACCNDAQVPVLAGAIATKFVRPAQFDPGCNPMAAVRRRKHSAMAASRAWPGRNCRNCQLASEGNTLEGTVVIVGGTGGIGSALARRLSARDVPLHLVGRDIARLQQVSAETGATFAVADVMDTQALVTAVQAASGPTAGLVYAVGSINLKPLARLSAEDFAGDFALNALGAAIAVQAALPAMKAHAAISSVVLFSTVAVGQGFAGHASVAMAKGAIQGLTRALGAELAPKIRVNAIAPSLTRTPLARSFTSNEATASAIAQMHALGRLGEADDVAAAADFLLSDQAAWITGQVLGVDGGRSTLRTKG